MSGDEAEPHVDVQKVLFSRARFGRRCWVDEDMSKVLWERFSTPSSVLLSLSQTCLQPEAICCKPCLLSGPVTRAESHSDKHFEGRLQPAPC